VNDGRQECPPHEDAGQKLDNSVIAYFQRKTEAETNIRAIIGRWVQVPGNSQWVPFSLLGLANDSQVEAIGRRSLEAILGGRFFGAMRMRMRSEKIAGGRIVRRKFASEQIRQPVGEGGEIGICARGVLRA
jgi:hypothetical protein